MLCGITTVENTTAKAADRRQLSWDVWLFFVSRGADYRFITTLGEQCQFEIGPDRRVILVIGLSASCYDYRYLVLPTPFCTLSEFSFLCTIYWDRQHRPWGEHWFSVVLLSCTHSPASNHVGRGPRCRLTSFWQYIGFQFASTHNKGYSLCQHHW